MRLFSTKNRPAHLGPYPLERLERMSGAPDLSNVPPQRPVRFDRSDKPENIVNAMAPYQAALDAIRDGDVNPVQSTIPDDHITRAEHLKAFGYFSDASLVGIADIHADDLLDQPIANRGIDALVASLDTREVRTLAAGIDTLMAELRDSLGATRRPVSAHRHALVFLYEYHRDPRPDEPGSEWITDAQDQRACLLGAETAIVIANYIRLLGFDAKAHTGAATDVDLNRLAITAGLTTVEDGQLVAPWIGPRFGLAAVTTEMALQPDQPLAPLHKQPWHKTNGPAWWLGTGTVKSALNRDPYAKRDYAMGAHPFERLKRVGSPTTYIDEPNVARVPKRADMFARAQFGDMGKHLQECSSGGYYVRKAAPSYAQRRALGVLTPLQDGPVNDLLHRPSDPTENAAALKAASYFLSIDAVGTSRCPDWVWYSHDATGAEITPPHNHAVSMIVDQGFETMEGASGDDWIAVSQSMRAYLRFSLIGGVIAQQIRNLGFSAKAHTVMDGAVLQPPLLLLAGLGEVSRIGEVILNPYLGPRLKSGVVTTDMPIAHDKPIDFGLQRFCEACNKCARECPSGAITAGPKLIFNGYEIWKSDSQKCTTYRVTQPGGAMCGRCMKTCPWNLEGLFAQAPFRWAASNLPGAAPILAKLDDAVGNGELNDIKKWWWDLKLGADGGYHPTDNPVNRRGLNRDLDLRYEDQTLAVYPASLAPPPYPYPFPMDREAGIAAYQAMIPARDYRARLGASDRSMINQYTVSEDTPVLQLVVNRIEPMTSDITKYEFAALDGAPLPEWTAGAHLDVLVSPDFLRQYSLSGDPADRKTYEIGVLREPDGRGGSALLHRIFTEGRKVFVAKPINHFELDESATKTLLMGGGIGITPMIAFAHRLHAIGADFVLHYSASRRADAGFLKDLASMPWADHVHLHFSDEGTRADFDAVLAGAPHGTHVYCCGADRYMSAVMEAAERQDIPENARHLEYFNPPEQPEYENHPFTIKLKDGRRVEVHEDQTAADALNAAGIHVDVKCADGLCGVCKCGVIAGLVEHRDFVLSNAQRNDAMILCQSRAADPEGEIELDL
ncbi:2Fe-2S iron-sulfur cluster-binding protein [Aliiroseovarius sp. S1339]|uniref:2Fe-2S iron-sulfur cluster-binding protein n=1 Tax=Aliiroseovarius sp. S1339 TaxID=2936990 RepID=UPI0020C1352F|nr:2Fe-2S iron-sulfur cluster-binding protein [Aliiroseovarius sp. S1339]MCK8464374.1 2Fe-2S iron-sulfur cluster-binding protein [Aliiroseovarius sp. S1339]